MVCQGYAKIYGKNKSFTHEIVKKGKENCISFAVTCQTTGQNILLQCVITCLVKMEKALNLCVYIQEKNTVHLAFDVIHSFRHA
jgi:hypothetical protein